MYTSKKLKNMGAVLDHYQIEERIDYSENPSNGMEFQNCYIPEEILILILSHVSPKDLLKCSLVCKNWNDIIKSNSVWIEKYKRKYQKKPKNLPWYVYYALLGTNLFDTNFLRNTNGEEKLKHWFIIQNGGDGWLIENIPSGCSPLPPDVDDFKGKLSCFSTSFGACTKKQIIHINKSLLYTKILNEFKPHIYVSEWTCGRFDCGSLYRLDVKLLDCDGEIVGSFQEDRKIEQFSDPQWEKIEILIPHYNDNLATIEFYHKGKDTQFWKGHYGSKMAGAVVKVLFDSIKC